MASVLGHSSRRPARTVPECFIGSGAIVSSKAAAGGVFQNKWRMVRAVVAGRLAWGAPAQSWKLADVIRGASNCSSLAGEGYIPSSPRSRGNQSFKRVVEIQ